jgi:hypothetical protein
MRRGGSAFVALTGMVPVNVEMWKNEQNRTVAFSRDAYPERTAKTVAREEVHHGPTVQAELSAQIERAWFIRFDLHIVPSYSCYRED